MLLTSFIVVFPIEMVKATGNTLYVGGDGPGNYTSIQSAIDAANPGDTIFVYIGTYYESIVIDKSIDLIGEDKETTIIDAEKNGHVVVILSNYVTVDGFTVRNGDSYLGFKLDGSIASNNIIRNCIIYNNFDGIYMWEGASYNTIENCYIYQNCFYGVVVQWTEGNTILNCEVSNNKFGIHFYSCVSNGGTLRGNKINNNDFESLSIAGDPTEGIPFQFDIDTSNTINGKPVYFVKNQSDLVFDETMEIGYLALISCNNILVKNIKISTTGCGILLHETTDSIIEESSFLNSFKGIWISCSNNNIIRNCTAKGNVEGIFFEFSYNNNIYHNDFKKNNLNAMVWDDYTTNVWDDGEGKGNYWDDYTGDDDDGDGIGDTPYIISSNNVDRYPSMEPMHSNSKSKSAKLVSSYQVAINILGKILDKYPHLFPILRLLLGLQ